MPGPKVACPHCKAVLQMPHALPAGQRVKCSSCGIHFAVGGEPPIPKAAPVAPAGPGAPAPAFPSAGLAASPGINRKALLYILAGGLLFLGGGTALILLCFSGKGPTENKEVVNGTGEPTDEGNDPDKKKVRKIDTHKPPPPPPELANYLTRDQKGQVQQAVQRGVAYLKSLQNPDGTWTATHNTLPGFTIGVTALVGLTLLECGAKKDDPAIQKVAAFLRQKEGPSAQIVNTYEIALAILFLDRLNDPQDKDRIAKLALRLVGGQLPSGGWTYTCPILSDADSQILANLLEKNKDQLAPSTASSKLELCAVDLNKLRLDDNKPVPAQLIGLTVWHTEAVFGQDSADNSNTQFAILGIWAAKTRKLPVQRTLALIVSRFHKGQFADGSWAYQLITPPQHGIPTMTCAGLLGLAVGQGLVNEARGQGSATRKVAQQDPAIQHGLDYLGNWLGDPHSPWQNATRARQGNLYFLWSVERVGVIYNLAKIGGKDWYGWGAEQLIANQTIAGDKGYWANGGGYYAQHPTINTCFALLFLQRANLAKDLTSKLALGD